MCQVLCDTIEEGLGPSEKVARFRTADGQQEEVTVSERQIVDRTIEASEIGRQGGRVLIELPRESASGRWCVWVEENQLKC